MTSSFIVNIKGATTAPASSLKNNSACFDSTSKDPISSSSVSARRAAEIRGTKSASVKVGLPRTVSLCDKVLGGGGSSNSSQVRGSAGRPSLLDSVCISSSVAPNRIKRAESLRCSSKIKSHRNTDSERRCYPATDREPVIEDEKAETSTSEFQSSGQATLSKLSHFLRELARQDCWAGLLEPFQGAGGNISPGNYAFEDWKLRRSTSSPVTYDRFSPNMTTPDYDLHVSIAPYDQDSVAEQQDQSSVSGSGDSSTRLAAHPSGSDILRPSGTVATASRSLDGIDSSFGSQGGTVSNGSAKVNGSKVIGPGPHGPGVSSRIRIHDKPQAELCHKTASCVTAEDIGSCENLALWLEERIGSSALSKWGSAAATKRVANLWCELVEGEISLEDSRPPKRTAHVASVKIRNGQGHVLVEAYQQMADGRIRPRNRPLSEKMRPGEHVEEACLRGIFEELGCDMGARERVMMVPESYKREEEERESFSYPGLPTRYVIHTMVAHIEQLPSTEFSTEEDESNHGSSMPTGALSDDGAKSEECGAPVGVKRHFWKWVPENKLADVCRR